MLRLHVLGNIELTNDRGEVLDDLLKQKKRLALLVYLAVARPRGFHRRDRLLGLFWLEQDQEHARASLRKAVYVVRDGVEEDDVVVSRGDEELGIAPGKLWCDVVAFEEALERGRLAQALELYRGDFLQGFYIPAAPEFDQWVDAERLRLRELAAKAAWKLAEEFGSGDQMTMATQWVWRAVRLNWDDERGVRRGMKLLARAGDRAGVHKMYDEFARRMKKEYDAEPSEETKELLRDIREGRFPPRESGNGTKP
jgi:DNA-binding SARP family transcriptional activator